MHSDIGVFISASTIMSGPATGDTTFKVQLLLLLSRFSHVQLCLTP